MENNNSISFKPTKESTKNNELNKENQSSNSMKRNCTNRHSLQNKNHPKLEFKNSLNKFSQRTQLSTLSNSISSIPVFEYLNKNESTLLSTSSDGAMTSGKKQSKNSIKTDNRLSPTTKLNYFTNELSSNYLNHLSTNNTLSTNYEQQNKTTNKRRASMTDNGYMNSGVPTKMAISQIQEFVETSIVLKKGKDNQLGISIIGGSDTYLESICVKEVHENTAAYADGRIRKGDIILACNEYSFRTVNYADAIRVLKEASSPLKLLILRENPQKLFTTSQSPNKFITVELKKQSIKDKLGISLIQRTNGSGVFVTYVVPNSIAAIQGKGKILQGDQLLEINGQNVKESNQKDVANQLNQLDGEIVLLLGRVPSLTTCIQEWCRKRMQIHWRTRTSTWSAYGGSKDKIQNQRPSLPVNTGKETPLFNTHSPEMESRPQSPFSSNRPSICSQIQFPLQSTKMEIVTKGQQFQQALSQQLDELQNQDGQKIFKQPLTYNSYSDKYSQACVNTPEDAISFSFSRSSSVRNRHLSVLIEDPCYNNKNTIDLDLNKDNYLSKSPSLFSTNINHLFTDPDDSAYEIEPIDEQTTCYLAEKLDAENKFIPYDQLDKKDQQELMEQQLKQQRLAFKEERQAHYNEKHHKSKHHKQQIITSVNPDQTQSHRHHKRSFLIRRSNSSKQATKKNHIPSIQVTEF